ncbi:hypothetical protein [Leptospira johnsonii]|uniref:Uncharacterized protein n=1 Tax=Leptospira johnsonii TaxID=1917820 RepID=A0A2P2D7X2_9LEPT|nr:hypothetical protein [Leptospira johnsonii]GBF40729.1 hypothetical protein LPTSP1_37470 [Leptospira johnsonii]
MKINFASQSDDDRENHVISEFVKFVAEDSDEFDTINIERIPEEDFQTPDFLVRELKSIVEIKKVTEDPSYMQKIGSLRHDVLSKITKDIEEILGNLTDNTLVSINNSRPLKSRGEDYKSLIRDISKDIREKNDYGFSGEYGYRIDRNSESTPQLMVIYSGFEYPTPEKLAEHIKSVIAKAGIQLNRYQEIYKLQEYKKILVFDHFFTHTENLSFTVKAIEIAYNLSPAKELDNIFLQMNEAIVRIR